MYRHLAGHFAAKRESRVQFVIPEGPHSYMEIYDLTLRFHHGHMIKFGGGIGGHRHPGEEGHRAVEQGASG
jgi:hypothetical protein